MAHERQLIHKGCVLKVTVTNPEDMVTTSSNPSEAGKSEDPVSIKLQLLKKGGKTEKYEDINIDPNENPFSMGFK